MHATTKVLEALGPNLDFDIPLIVSKWTYFHDLSAWCQKNVNGCGFKPGILGMHALHSDGSTITA